MRGSLCPLHLGTKAHFTENVLRETFPGERSLEPGFTRDVCQSPAAVQAAA